MQREPTAISLVAMAIPNMPVRSQRPMSENVVNSIPSMSPIMTRTVGPLAVSQRAVSGVLAVGEREFGAERHERAGERPAHPGEDPGPRDDVRADRCGEEPIADED